MPFPSPCLGITFGRGSPVVGGNINNTVSSLQHFTHISPFNPRHNPLREALLSSHFTDEKLRHRMMCPRTQ